MEILCHEDELAACCKNLDKLTKLGRRIGAITQRFKESFDSLDTTVEDHLKLRYLLIYAHEQLASKPKKFMIMWHKELEKRGLTSDLLDGPSDSRSRARNRIYRLWHTR